MTSLWNKVFARPPGPIELETPDDTHLDREMARVEAENVQAVKGVERVLARQKDDTRIIRQVIENIIDRQEQRLQPKTGDRR